MTNCLDIRVRRFRRPTDLGKASSGNYPAIFSHIRSRKTGEAAGSSGFGRAGFALSAGLTLKANCSHLNSFRFEAENSILPRAQKPSEVGIFQLITCFPGPAVFIGRFCSFTGLHCYGGQRSRDVRGAVEIASGCK